MEFFNKYIVTKRFKGKAICGDLNLPVGTECFTEGDVICYDKGMICGTKSQNAYDYFARNDDNNGLERGNLTRSIIRTLSKRDTVYQSRWDKVWADPICNKYKRSDYDDYWLWSHDFYNAEIQDLIHIKNLIGA